MDWKPEISVIIVSYNTASLTLRCLASIRRHCAGTPYEVIVVDNASSDESTPGVAAQFPEVKLIVNDRNVGFGPANNQAAKTASGRYLFFLNSDTELVEDSLAVLKDFLDQRPKAAAVGCRLIFPDNKIQPSAAHFPNLVRVMAGREVFSGHVRRLSPRLADKLTFFLPQEDLTAPRRVDWCIGAALLIRREAFESIGGFDPRIFLYAEEMDLCLSLTRAGWQVWFSPATSIVHYEAASSGQVLTPRRLAYIAAGHRYFYRKHKGRLGWFYCLCEVGVSMVKAVLWCAYGTLAPGGLKNRYFQKALWHWLYVRNYGAVSY